MITRAHSPTIRPPLALDSDSCYLPPVCYRRTYPVRALYTLYHVQRSMRSSKTFIPWALKHNLKCERKTSVLRIIQIPLESRTIMGCGVIVVNVFHHSGEGGGASKGGKRGSVVFYAKRSPGRRSSHETYRPTSPIWLSARFMAHVTYT